MISILLAEDEFITRVGIRYCLDNAEGPFQLIGEAVDGKQALQMCREKKPDILLTDIRMPEMDGLELIRHIREENLDIRVLILTCLEDFGYLHEAMHLGIEDYILKTALKPEKLLDALEKVRQKYWTGDGSGDSGEQGAALEALESILSGYVNETEEIERMVNTHHLDLKFDRFVMMLVSVEEENQSLSLTRGLRAALADCVKRRGHGDVIRYDKTRFLVLSECPAGQDREFLQGLSDEMKETCRLNLNVSLKIGISDIHHQAEHIPNALEEADCALAHMYFEPGKETYFFGERKGEEHSAILKRLHTELEGLQTAASAQDRERLLHALKRFEASAREASLQGVEIWPWYLRAYFDTASAFSESMGSAAAVDEMDLIGREIRQVQSPDHVVSAATRLIEEMAMRLGEVKREPANSLIRQVLAYTDDHYMDNLSLDFISQTFAIHPAYFCKLFKRTMGITYIDYVTSCRIQKAKELLTTTDLPNYLIAEKTGFQTPEYFSKTFKKKTGVSPKDYRQR